mgnify:FL=1|jgi:hypothetical protein
MSMVKYVDQACGDTGGCAPVDKLKVVGKKAVQQLQFDIWDTIGCADDNIVRVYNKGQCVVENCKIYKPLADNTIDQPSVGVTKVPPTWEGGVTLCEALSGALLDPASLCKTLHKFAYNGAVVGG